MKLIRIVALMLIFSTLLMNIIRFSVVRYDNYINVKKYYNEYNQKEYYGVLKIPKLNLSNIVFNETSKENNVNKNIELIKADNNILVLAAHSGNSEISYFKNLDKLIIGDYAYLLKNNSLNKYELFLIDNVDKDNSIRIIKHEYPTMIFVTCAKDKEKLDLYYLRLIQVQKEQKNDKKC